MRALEQRLTMLRLAQAQGAHVERAIIDTKIALENGAYYRGEIDAGELGRRVADILRHPVAA